MDHEQHLREMCDEPKPPGKYAGMDWETIRWTLAEIDRLRRLVAEREAELADEGGEQWQK